MRARVRIWLASLALVLGCALPGLAQEPMWCDSCDEVRGSHTATCPERPRPAPVKPKPTPRPPRPARALFEDGIAASAAGRLNEAVELYRDALAYEPEHVGAWRNLGSVFWRLSRWAEAEHAYEEAFARRPSRPAEQRLGDLRLAWRSADLKRRRTRIWARSRADYAAGDARGAVAELEQLRTWDARVWHFLARALVAVERGPAAEVAYREALALERDPSRRSLLELEEQALSEQGREAKRLAEQRQAQLRVSERVRAGELAKARQLLEARLSADPDPRWAFERLGSLALERRPLRGAAHAEWALRRALWLDAERSATWTNLGVLYDRAGHPQRALVIYRRALDLDATRSEIAARVASLEAAQSEGPRPFDFAEGKTWLPAPTLLGRTGPRRTALPSLELTPLRDLLRRTGTNQELVIRFDALGKPRTYRAPGGPADATLTWLQDHGSLADWPELEGELEPAAPLNLDGPRGWRFD